MALTLFIIWCLAGVFYEPLAIILTGVYAVALVIAGLNRIPTVPSGYERPPSGGGR